MSNTANPIKTLHHPQWQVRVEALRAIHKNPLPAAHSIIIDLLKHDERANVRYHAAYSLRCYPTKTTVEVLIHALVHDVEADVRYRVAYVLGEIGDVDALDTLMNALDDEKWHVRHSAAVAISKLNCEAALPALEKCLANDPSMRVRQSASDAITAILSSDAIMTTIKN